MTILYKDTEHIQNKVYKIKYNYFLANKVLALQAQEPKFDCQSSVILVMGRLG